MRAAWRAEQDAATRDATEDWQHRQTLVDRLRAHMHRGDGLTVTVLGRRLVGFVEEVGDDVLALRTVSGRIDVHLAPSIAFEYAVTAPAREGGHRGPTRSADPSAPRCSYASRTRACCSEPRPTRTGAPARCASAATTSCSGHRIPSWLCHSRASAG